MTFADDQFERAGRLALKLAGIELAGRHRELLRRRCQRQGIHDAAGLEPVLAGVEQGNAEAAQKFLSLVTTKFTGFFRERSHFQIAAEHAVRVAGLREHVRIWSAAAATGEEPYSLAMAAIEVFGRDDPPVSILATNVNADSLAVAEHGESCSCPSVSSHGRTIAASGWGALARSFALCSGTLRGRTS